MLNSLGWSLLCLIAIAALVNWIGAWDWKPKLYYASKPLVLLLLILFFLIQIPLERRTLPFLVGLAFSLAGDVLLIPKGTRWFLAGAGAFSIAQLCYIVGFNLSLPSIPVLLLAGFALIVCVLIIHLAIERFAKSSTVSKSLLPFLKSYALLVIAMAISAVICIGRPGWSDSAAVMAGMGGVLFALSDVMIGSDKLERRLPRCRFWIIITYHLAQFLIVAAIVFLTKPMPL